MLTIILMMKTMITMRTKTKTSAVTTIMIDCGQEPFEREIF